MELNKNYSLKIPDQKSIIFQRVAASKGKKSEEINKREIMSLKFAVKHDIGNPDTEMMNQVKENPTFENDSGVGGQLV